MATLRDLALFRRPQVEVCNPAQMRMRTGYRAFGAAQAGLGGIVALLGGILGLAGCPAGKRVIPKASFAAKTTIRLATGRCKGQTCACRSLASNDTAKELGIPTGYKRFELRLPKTPSSLWVSIDHWGVYYKAPNQLAPQCFYVDLDPGRHRVTLHGENRDLEVGLQTGLTIYEYGEPRDGGPGWYRSFHFACGVGASSCTKDELIDFRAAQQKLPRGVLDYCGSVMVKGVSFGGTRAQKGDTTYRDMTLRFSLQVYEFEPHWPPRSPKCKRPTKNR